jgi:hypothetical protein
MTKSHPDLRGYEGRYGDADGDYLDANRVLCVVKILIAIPKYKVN